MATTAALAVSAAAAAYGAYSQNQAAGANARLSRQQQQMQFMNYLENRKLRQLQEEMAKASTVDARGNVTEFVPGVGWITRPTETTRNLIGASDAEQRLRLAQDMTRGRMQRENNFARQQQEGADANAVLSGLNVGGETLDELRNTLIERNVARAMSGNNAAKASIGTTALRQGTGGEAALAQLGRNSIADTRTALAEARADANPSFAERRSARVNPILNQYNILASRATAPEGTPFNPTSLDEGLARTLAQRSNQDTRGLSYAMQNVRPPSGGIEDFRPAAIYGGAKSLGEELRNEKLWAGVGKLFGSGSYVNPYSGSTPYTNDPSYLSFGNTQAPVSYENAWASSGYNM
jgi:hypothetical protein